MKKTKKHWYTNVKKYIVNLYYLTFYKKRLEKERLQILSGLLDTDNSIWKYVIDKRKAIPSLASHMITTAVTKKMQEVRGNMMGKSLPSNPSTGKAWFINEKPKDSAEVIATNAEFTGSLNNEDSTKIAD
jgi:hypothetical protein